MRQLRISRAPRLVLAMRGIDNSQGNYRQCFAQEKSLALAIKITVLWRNSPGAIIPGIHVTQFSPDQNALARRLIREIIRSEYKGKEAPLARAIGVSQPVLNLFLKEKKGMGGKLLNGLERLKPSVVDRILKAGVSNLDDSFESTVLPRVRFKEGKVSKQKKTTLQSAAPASRSPDVYPPSSSRIAINDPQHIAKVAQYSMREGRRNAD